MARLPWLSWRWITITGTPRGRAPGRGGGGELVAARSAAGRRGDGRRAQLGAGGGGRLAPARRAGEDAEEWSDGEADARLEPGPRLSRSSSVHADLAAAAALAALNQYRAAALIEIGLGERQRLMDPQSGYATGALSTGAAGRRRTVAGGARDSDNFPRPWADRRDTGRPCCAAVGRRGISASSPVTDDGRRDRAAART
jgi:hypothetical protein